MHLPCPLQKKNLKIKIKSENSPTLFIKLRSKGSKEIFWGIDKAASLRRLVSILWLMYSAFVLFNICANNVTKKQAILILTNFLIVGVKMG